MGLGRGRSARRRHMCIMVEGLGDEISMAPQRARTSRCHQVGAGMSSAYDQILGRTWESRDSLTCLEGCLCVPHILFLIVSGEERLDLAARTRKHFAFRSDLILLVHPLSQALASLAMKHSARLPVFRCRSLFKGILSPMVSLLQRARFVSLPK